MTQQRPQVTVQNERVFQWWDYPLFIVLTAISTTAIGSFLWHWFTLKDWRSFPVLFSIATVILLTHLFVNQVRWFVLLYMKKPKPMKARCGWKVGVVTTFVPGAESIDMLERTVNALTALDYPHETWVLDEGDDEHVKRLCQKLGANYFSRRKFPQYQTQSGIFQVRSKHGNYNAWLYEIGFARYDIIAAFDPDHVPIPTFLSQVLGYFDDPKIGYVQAPQVCYNQEASFIARGAAEETFAYYSSTQMASYSSGYPFLAGCHNTHRVAALQQVGGFAPHDADDLLLSLFYRLHHWQGVYIPQVLAQGLAPVDWRGYLTQQRRVGRAILDSKLRVYPKFAKKLALKERIITFVDGIAYIQGSVSICVGLVMLAMMLISGAAPQITSYETTRAFLGLSVILQLCFFYRQRFYLDWRNEWGWHWRAKVLRYAKWPYLLFAFYEVMRGRRLPYAITKKVKERNRYYPLLLWPHLVVATLIGTSWVIGVVSGQSIPLLLHACAAFLVVGSLVLIATECVTFPDPYDHALLPFTVLRTDNEVT